MKADYVHKDTLTATDYVELNKNNELLISYNQALLKENKELKKKYENAVADYENAMFEKNELKKQLEEYKKDIEDLDNQNQRAFKNMQLNQLKTCNMIKQQKEFIKWLENYINLFDKKDIYEEGSCDTIEEILQKYKSIIGDDK